jgi:MFS family permease
MGAFFSELFDTRVRYSGSSVSYALAGVLGAALAPLISVRLLAATGCSWSVSLYIFAMALVSFVAVLLLSEDLTQRPLGIGEGRVCSHRRLAAS